MSNTTPLVMIVDDTPQNLQYLADLVQKNGYDFVMADNGNQVLEFVKLEKPDLILLDVMMPDLDGYEVCRKLKQNKDTADIPIIFITAKSDIEDILAGFQIGGVDYVTKPFNSVILEARMRTHVELKRSSDHLKIYIDELTRTNLRLQEEMERANNLATHDYLTGLYNRRFMMERIKVELPRSNRSGQPVSIVVSDIDDFKQFNDQYGHDCGDFILVSVSKTIQDTLRAHDIIARWGGEEFLILLPDTDKSGASVVAQKLRARVAESVYTYNDRQLSVTMTFGLSLCGADDFDYCIKRADSALIQGKNSGKNCVMVAGNDENIT